MRADSPRRPGRVSYIQARHDRRVATTGRMAGRWDGTASRTRCAVAGEDWKGSVAPKTSGYAPSPLSTCTEPRLFAGTSALDRRKVRVRGSVRPASLHRKTSPRHMQPQREL